MPKTTLVTLVVTTATATATTTIPTRIPIMPEALTATVSARRALVVRRKEAVLQSVSCAVALRKRRNTSERNRPEFEWIRQHQDEESATIRRLRHRIETASETGIERRRRAEGVQFVGVEIEEEDKMRNDELDENEKHFICPELCHRAP